MESVSKAVGRRSISQAEELALTTQVDGVCPICGVALFYKKNGQSHKNYEIAHIYPLKPKPEEAALLEGQERLGEDVNDVENLIPLCPTCHTQFDKPRTVAEYQELVAKKKEVLVRASHQKLQYEYQLEEDIGRIVEALDQDAFTASGAELQFDAKPIDEKFDTTMPRQTRRKIRLNVNDYFVHVRQRFKQLDAEKPGTGELIASQVRTFYLAQKQHGLTQQQIFAGVVAWIASRTKPQTAEAAEIVASFFVQNCEVLE